MIDVTMHDGIADAYLARPDGGGHPAVLLVVDAFGLRPQIERMADRIAAQGFVVLAPNVFYRAGRAPVVPLDGLGDPEQRASVFERVTPLIRELTPERIVRDGGAYLDLLEQVGRGPVAIAELERALDAAGVRYRSELYRGAAHGYTMADTPAYDDDAAERHYTELFALLERSIVRRTAP